MEVHMHHIPQSTGKWELTRRLAGDVLHKGPFLQQSEPNEHFQKINFEVFLHPHPAGGAGHSGKGILTLPTKPIGFQFLDYIEQSPFKINGRKIKFFKLNRHDPPPWKTLTLQNTRYIDPDHEEKIEQKMYALHDSFRVNLVQFGILFRPDPIELISLSNMPLSGMVITRKRGLGFDLNMTGNSFVLSQVGEEQEGSTIAISFSSIQKIAIGYDGPLYVCFDTFFPPVFEKKEFNRSSSGNHREDNQNYRLRLRSLHPGHQEVSPYAQKLRITLYDNRSVDTIIETFKQYCRTAELPVNKVLECEEDDIARIEATDRYKFFTQRRPS
ncbi:hypothetical protein K435DRAFT_858480 [Dendrothele bispora CBS 962.96]|uniref:Uncharacterized protein n=1 Tax=Dendrothele bispora (strain CBS 962.96) TaxID=1314807 RepID=A0A4S8M317_DENBC|nr:hypothetical protein K435DRAFT_858480 [Dendrothele bispora CBS 962.96]